MTLFGQVEYKTGAHFRCILFGSDHSMPRLSVASNVCHSAVCGGAGLNFRIIDARWLFQLTEEWFKSEVVVFATY